MTDEHNMIDYKLEHLFSYTGTLANPPEFIGPLPEGIRVNFYSSGGEFKGAKIRGRIRAVGGDWVTVRKDGVALLNVRATFQTHDGALILVTYQGLIDFGADGHDRFLHRDLPARAQIRTTPCFLTSHPDYAWLNRLHCLGIGEYCGASNEAKYDVYAVC